MQIWGTCLEKRRDPYSFLSLRKFKRNLFLSEILSQTWTLNWDPPSVAWRREIWLSNANVGLRHNLTVCPDAVAPGNVSLAMAAQASLNVRCPRRSRACFRLGLTVGVQGRRNLWKRCRVRMSNHFLPPINPQPAVICWINCPRHCSKASGIYWFLRLW